MTLDIQFASSANPCSYYGNISIGDKIEMIKKLCKIDMLKEDEVLYLLSELEYKAIARCKIF